MEASGGSQEYVVVGIISKLLTDLVARNDQVGPAAGMHSHHFCALDDLCSRLRAASRGAKISLSSAPPLIPARAPPLPTSLGLRR